jgi:hypothetical protein
MVENVTLPPGLLTKLAGPLMATGVLTVRVALLFALLQVPLTLTLYNAASAGPALVMVNVLLVWPDRTIPFFVHT